MKKNRKELREIWFITEADKSSVDNKSRTLSNAVLMKPRSANGYTYTNRALQQFVEKAGKPKSYFDHSMWNDFNRPVRDLAGFIDNIRLEGDAIRGDAHIAPVEHGDMVLWFAELQPNVVGFSAVSEAIMNDEESEVLEILQVISIDIVTNPATVKGLFERTRKYESLIKKEPEMDEKEKQRLEKEIQALNESNISLKSQIAALTKERNDALDENRSVKRENFIAKTIAEAKLPEKSVTPVFRKQLQEAADEETVKALIEDRKTVAGDSVTGGPSGIMSKDDPKPAPSNGDSVSEADRNAAVGCFRKS